MSLIMDQELFDQTAAPMSELLPEVLSAATLRREPDGMLLALEPRTTFGRSSRCDVVVGDASVSSQHAVLLHNGVDWCVRDLGSRNGTRVDGVGIEPGVDVALAPGSCFELALDGAVWRLVDCRAPGASDARPSDGTLLTATAHRPASLAQVGFHFTVSADEEHATWEADFGHKRVGLGDRSYVYLLVTLARARYRERELPPEQRGWVGADRLARRLGMTPETLKVHVYRARQALRNLGVIGAAGIVERRAASNQIRIGTDRIAVQVQ